MKKFLQFEKEMLSEPKTMFPMLEESLKGRRKIIFNEFLEWQKSGGKIQDISFNEIKQDGCIILCWKIGNENFAQKIDFEFFNLKKENYKKALSSVYSFLEDRPQYFKFRNLEGMFNPLNSLLIELID